MSDRNNFNKHLLDYICNYKYSGNYEKFVFNDPLIIDSVPNKEFIKFVKEFLDVFYVCGPLKRKITKKCIECNLPSVDGYNYRHLIEYNYDIDTLNNLKNVRIKCIKEQFNNAISDSLLAYLIENEVYTVYDFFVLSSKERFDIIGEQFITQIRGLANIFNEFFLNLNHDYSYLVEDKETFILELKKLGFSYSAYSDILKLLDFININKSRFDDTLHNIKEYAINFKTGNYSFNKGINYGFNKNYEALDEVIDKIDFFETAISYDKKSFKK